MLYKDKHNYWTRLCLDCEDGKVEFHTATTYLGGMADCDTCEGAGEWNAELSDFENQRVRLVTGEIGLVALDGNAAILYDDDGQLIDVTLDCTSQIDAILEDE